MVDHRHTIGKCCLSYPCYVLKLPKIALVVVSWTRSPAAVDGFLGTRPSTFFQVHSRRCIFRCTVSSTSETHLNYFVNSELFLQETDNKSVTIIWIYQICAFWKFVPIFKLWIYKYDNNNDLSQIAENVLLWKHRIWELTQGEWN